MRNASIPVTSIGHQQIFGLFGSEIREMQLPHADSKVLPGIRWGEPGELFSPAFWAHQVWLFEVDDSTTYHVGDTLVEEIASCLLGGYGIRAELALSAFWRLKEEGLLVPGVVDHQTIEKVLSQPFLLGRKSLRYRFPKQKARYLAVALRTLAVSRPPVDRGGRILRDWLLQLPGVGLKTAGWIARNWLKSDEVAIIDIHIFRAGLLSGFFSFDQRIERDYLDLERRFLQFAVAMNIRPSALDAVMWEQMREFGTFALDTLKDQAGDHHRLEEFEQPEL